MPTDHLVHTAADPKGTFYSYVNALHDRIHPVFAEYYLKAFGRLNSHHPLHDPDTGVFVALMFEIDPKTGALLRVAVSRPSGQATFDVAALESLRQALPIEVPPALARSNKPLRFNWEFHRKPEYACSTYFVWVTPP